MALRLRRGTDAERGSVIFAEGELVYVTDTRQLWAGDGATPGGVLVSVIGSPEALDKNLDLSGFDIIGAGQIGDANTTFVGDGSGLFNLPIINEIDGVIEGGAYRIDIVGDDTSTIIDSATNTVTGILVGDGSGITDISLNQLTDVTLPAPDEGELLTYSGGTWQSLPPPVFDLDPATIVGADFQLNIIGPDSTRIVDSELGILRGYLEGDVQGDVFGQNSTKIVDSTTGTITGDLVGSVFGDDSSVIIDSINKHIYTNLLSPATGGTVSIQSIASETTLRVEANDNRGVLKFTKNSASDISGVVKDPYGSIFFERDGTGNAAQSTALITGRSDSLLLGVYDGISTFPESNFFTITSNGNMGIGTFDPTAPLDVRGNAVFAGDVQAAAFKGSLMADDSSTVVDGITGAITAPSYVQFGSFTTAERDALTPSNGMVIYNTTTDAFQGYAGSTWTDIKPTPSIISVATSRALVITDTTDILEVDTSGGAVDISIPDNATVAFPIGTVINVTLVDATAAATITGGAGVTLNGVATGSGAITATAYSGISLYKRATDAWVVQGAIGTVA